MSFFALDINGCRVYIDNAHIKNDYFCQCCGAKLLIKRGAVKAHHFAHFPNCSCNDDWHYEEMSEWHKGWQEKFPEDSREIVMRKGQELHRADVFLKESNTVIEFQHSNLTFTEFEKRNSFYSSFGYKVVWLFDFRDDFKRGTMKRSDSSLSKYKWSNARKTFDEFHLKNEQNVALFFQLGEEKDNPFLEKVVWIAPSGFEHFFANSISLENFLNACYGRQEVISFEKHTICGIASNIKARCFIVRNKQNDEKVMIVSDPITQYEKYHKVYGRTEDTFGEFKKQTVEIKDFDRPVWRLVWKK